jgi:uncharacterized protein (DUF486 family)
MSPPRLELAILAGMRVVLLLVASNVFMVVAWYGHLRFKDVPVWQAVLGSWAIALFEYALHVPASRWGHGTFSLTELKILQEVITLAVFTVFAIVVFRELPRWNHVVAYGLLIAAVGFAFWPGARDAASEPAAVAQERGDDEPPSPGANATP